jgi:(p)ppGpp synthase/HD superfamily hydrolase
MAMYQDRIFAFTPKGELIQLPKGATPVDFAYAVHTDLGNQAVGARINSRVVPLKTIIENGDQVEILRSKGQTPQPNWLNFAITGKALASIRRHLRNTERDEQLTLGRKLYEDIVHRLPAQIGSDALAHALKRLKLADEPALLIAIARRTLSDAQVMEALMPGSAGGDLGHALPPQKSAISIRGLTPGVAFELATCCHPIPGDRIVGLRRPDAGIEVHAIDCAVLTAMAERSNEETDWVDVSWGETEGAVARISIEVRNEPGALGVIATVIGAHKANIINLRLDNRDTGFHTNTIDVEVHDLQQLIRLMAALRAADAVNAVERV